MEATELNRRTTARALAFANSSDDALARNMMTNMPRRGIAVANLPRQLPPSAYRLLDDRILNAAARFLDEDISEPLLAGLTKYRALMKAAQDSLVHPDNAEVMVSLIDPYEITSIHRPYLALVVDDNEIGRVVFEIKLVFGMFETSVAVRRGAIESVECNACALAITLSLVGWDQPLLHRTMQLPVRLPVRPPVVVPLPGTGDTRPRAAR